MQTASSAMPTCLRLRSTVECTATVRMPSVWQARSTRSAISPRLAMRTLSSMASADHEQRLIEFDRLAVLGHDRQHRAGNIGLELVEHLHRFDDAERIAGLDLRSDRHECRRARRGGGVESTNHRRAYDVTGREATLAG